MIDGSRGEASGIGAEGQGSDAIAVVAEGFRSEGGEKGVVDADGDVGGGRSDQVLRFLVPQDGAEGRAAALRGVGLLQLHRPDLHGAVVNGLGEKGEEAVRFGFEGKESERR